MAAELFPFLYFTLHILCRRGDSTRRWWPGECGTGIGKVSWFRKEPNSENLSSIYWFPGRSSEFPIGFEPINGQIAFDWLAIWKCQSVLQPIRQISDRTAGTGWCGALLLSYTWLSPQPLSRPSVINVVLDSIFVYLRTCYGHVGRLVHNMELGCVPRDFAPIGTCRFALQSVQHDTANVLVADVRLVRIQVHAIHRKRHDWREHHRRVPVCMWERDRQGS